MKDNSEAAMRPPTDEELQEATEVLEFVMSQPDRHRERFLAYFLREAEETGRQKERQSLGPR